MDDSSTARFPKFLIFIDGASRGNPGESAFALVIGNEKGEVIYQAAGRIGMATNNEAEYRALLEALDTALRLEMKCLAVFSDSELLVNQINGTYRIRSSRLFSLYQRVQTKIKQFREFSLTHIPREQNTLADRLASEILRQRVRYNCREGRSGNRGGTSPEESPSSTEQGTG